MAYMIWKLFFKKYNKVRRSVIYSTGDKKTDQTLAEERSSRESLDKLKEEEVVSSSTNHLSASTGALHQYKGVEEDDSENICKDIDRCPIECKNKSRSGESKPNKNITEVHSRPPERKHNYKSDCQEKIQLQQSDIRNNKPDIVHYNKQAPCYEKVKKSHRGGKRYSKKKGESAKNLSPTCNRHSDGVKLKSIHIELRRSPTPSPRRSKQREGERKTPVNLSLSLTKAEPALCNSVQSSTDRNKCQLNSSCNNSEEKTSPSAISPPIHNIHQTPTTLPSGHLKSPSTDLTVLSLFWMNESNRFSTLSSSSSPSLLSLNKKSSDVDQLVENCLNKLYTPFENLCVELVRQARDILVCNYQGNVKKFQHDFLLPAAALLTEFKAEERKAAVGTKFASHHGWPLCFQNRLLVHLGEADSSLVKHGDFYLCVRATHAAAGVQLVLKYRTRCIGIKEKVIESQEFSNIFTMDWFHSLQLDSASDDQWASQLQNMLVGVEKGIDRIRCDLVFRPTMCNHSAQTNDNDKSEESLQRHHSTTDNTCITTTNSYKDETRISSTTNVKCDVCHRHSTDVSKNLATLEPFIEPGKRDSSVQTSPMDECKTFSLEYSKTDKDNSCFHSLLSNENKKVQDIYQNKGEFKSAVKKRVVEDQDDGYHDNCITTPNDINELDPAILLSKVALLPGCRDSDGRAVVTIDCELLSSFPQFTSAQFAQLFLYFHSTLRKEVASKGLFVLVDVSKTTETKMLAFLDEIFCMIEGHIPGIIQILVLWSGECNADKWTKETQYFPQSSIQFELVTNQDRLFKLINQENLLPHYGGTYHFHLEEWHEFRKIFEPFVHECRSSGKRLVSVMQGLKGSRLPPSSSLTSQIIDEHKQLVVNTFDDPRLKRLQEDGKDTLKNLQTRQKQTPNNHDLMDSVIRGETLYNELQRAVVKLSRLSERRLMKFEQVLQMRVYEEDTEQVLNWLCKKGEETLDRFKSIADNLAAVRTQERDFEKFYFDAMRNIEKGHDLLEEAFTLGQGSSQEASGMQDLSQSLKTHLRGFSERLEDTRERLEDTSRCYQLLDKAYEWALEAMKFVSRLKMEQNMAGSQLNQLMKALHTYLQNNPPISNDVFQEMINLANKLENEKLLDQCKVAQTRCQETTDLIRTRQTTLLKARQQHGDLHAYSQLDLTDIAESPVAFNTSSPSWSQTPVTSTPQPFTRRRSVGSLPSCGYPTPSCYVSQGYSSFFREKYQLDTYISEHEENFVDEMISDFHSIPPPSIDGKQSSSASEESTVSSSKSIESLQVSSAEDTIPQSTSSTTTNPPHLPINHSKPHKKYMRRSQTWQFEMEPWQKVLPEDSCNLETNYTKGSTESIQTLVETEESSSLELTSSNTNTTTLYPPLSSVNSHLHYEEAGDVSNDLSQEEIKHKRTLALTMREMIQTERDYVKSLEYTIENYIPELLREDIPQALRGKRNVVFGNIEKIFEFHSQYFLHELERCDKTPFLVGQCFLRYERQFYLHALYNKNKPKSDELMLEYGTSFFKNKQLQLKDKMDLASYLLKPVQRLGKYALLIRQLVKECPEKDPEYSDLKAAEDMVKFQLRHGNDLLAMDCIRESDVDLKEQGRLLRQDEFLVWQGKGRKCLRRHLFLFEELIVFAKARRDPVKKSRDIYQYKTSIKMSDIGLTEQVGESSAKFEIWFRKCKLNDTYILQAGRTDIRDAWVQDISKLLWKQALRNRELRLAEMSSMGIGNKPCLDIKPSQDQINDRSISINQLTKAPRFRNSISVIPTDPARNTNKRPHSIISVSSSSSGSSQASSSQYGALNLGFDPSDSPKNHHRSITQQSQCSAESGIIPDISVGYDYLSEMDNSKKLERTSSNASSDSMSTNNSLPISPSTDTANSEIVTENR